MIIKESQIERIEELIEKGQTVQSSAIAGKKRYLAEIQDVLYSICKENNEETPIWVYLLQTAPVKIGSSGITVDVNLFIDKQIEYCQSFLKDIRFRYYTQKNIEVSQEQTIEMKKQTRLSIKSYYISKSAIAVSIVSALLALFAAYQSTKITKISLDEKQYNSIYQILSKDSLNAE